MRGSFLVSCSIALFFATPALAQGFAGLGSDTTASKSRFPASRWCSRKISARIKTFRTEWWYVTANLTDEAGAAYGVQWTLFRQASAPGDERPGWANPTVWMGHAAVTTATDHLFAETFARGGIGQAGVTTNPFRAWIDDWVFDGAKLSASGPASATPSTSRPMARSWRKATTGSA